MLDRLAFKRIIKIAPVPHMCYSPGAAAGGDDSLLECDFVLALTRSWKYLTASSKRMSSLRAHLPRFSPVLGEEDDKSVRNTQAIRTGKEHEKGQTTKNMKSK